MDGTLKLKTGQQLHRHNKERGGGDRAVFLPVDITGEVAGAPASGGLAKSRDGVIEIALGNGAVITVTGGFDVDAVARLVRVICQ